jgi:hypothetical protein
VWDNAGVPPLPRRTFLAGLAGTLATGRAAWAGEGAESFASRTPPDFTVMDLDVGGDPKLARRFTLFVPNHLAPGERVPLLVLLHGLGETGDPGLGVYAWVERYGLGTAYARLRRPPVARTARLATLLPDRRIAEINAALAAQPFRGMAVACPYTPNVGRLPDPEAALEAYAGWIVDTVVPRARAEAPVIADAAHTAIDGVSLGGYIGLEVFLRRPDAFAVWGGVQGAINVVRLSRYASDLAAIAARAARGVRFGVHIETTEADPFREVNTALADLLTKKGVPHDAVVLPGQHDQIFLRESGTLEMLLWHDRQLR